MGGPRATFFAPTTRKPFRVRRPDDDGGNRSASPSNIVDDSCSAGRHGIHHLGRPSDRDKSVAAHRSRSEAQLHIQNRPENTGDAAKVAVSASAAIAILFTAFHSNYIQFRRAKLRFNWNMLRALLVDTDQSPGHGRP